MLSGRRPLQVAGAQGLRAGGGGYGYLRQPMWWLGLLLMAGGEAANFAAYAFAPPMLVTPMGAISIVVSAVLAHSHLNERLNAFGVAGCVLSVVGSSTIVLHAPEEREVASIREMWALAAQPGFVVYALAALSAVAWLCWEVAPKHGNSNILVYLAICSIMGSLSVMSVKALAVAFRLTFAGESQLGDPATLACVFVVAACVTAQMNYLNKALDVFNTAIVSPIYYVMFTSLTVLASIILLRPEQAASELATQACGFVTIVCGVYILTVTKDLDAAPGLGRLGLAAAAGPGREKGGAGGALPLASQEDCEEPLTPSRRNAVGRAAGPFS